MDVDAGVTLETEMENEEEALDEVEGFLGEALSEGRKEGLGCLMAGFKKNEKVERAGGLVEELIPIGIMTGIVG